MSFDPGAERETSVGALRIECIVGADSKIQRGVERLNLDEIRPGDFVVVPLAEHSGWLETEQEEFMAATRKTAAKKSKPATKTAKKITVARKKKNT